jgi:hypothetical protein
VYNFFPNKLTKTVHDLIHDLKSLLLLELLAFYQLFQVSIFAKLSNDVQTVLGAQNVLELYDVCVVESFQQIDF